AELVQVSSSAGTGKEAPVASLRVTRTCDVSPISIVPGAFAKAILAKACSAGLMCSLQLSAASAARKNFQDDLALLMTNNLHVLTAFKRNPDSLERRVSASDVPTGEEAES